MSIVVLTDIMAILLTLGIFSTVSNDIGLIANELANFSIFYIDSLENPF